MTKDLETRADIDALMVSFYSKAMEDDLIGFFFHEVVQLDLSHHLPVIGDFWEAVLLGNGAYSKHGRNPLQVHAAMHERSEFRGEHFRRWLEIFGMCVDDLFSGPRAEFAKMRAEGIAGRMLEFVSMYGPARAGAAG